MAGYVIHLAVGKEYIRKFIDDIENEDEFFKGIIYPDKTKIKGETHYSPYYSSDVNLYDFVLDKKDELDTDFNKGYFLHLLTDFLFYNKYFFLPVDVDAGDGFYNDYDVLNDELVKKYNIVLSEDVKECVFSKEGELIYLDREKLDQCIDECSKYNIKEIENVILNEKDEFKIFNVSKEMKKRFCGTKANKVIEDKEIIIDDINDEFVKGKIALTKIIKTNTVWAVPRKSGIRESILDSGFYWLELYPLDKKYVYTGIFNEKKELIEIYIDITKINGVDGSIPYMVDMFLDIVYDHNFDTYILDEDELKNALEEKIISKEEYDKAYITLNEVLDMYKNKEELEILFDRFNNYLDNMLNK